MHNIEKKLDSREVAEMVGKEHNKLLRDIRSYIEQLNQSNIGHVDFFQEYTYKGGNGQDRPCYLITKKGCEFIAHKLTGIKGTEFTAKYINRFHEMEEVVRNPFEHLSKELQAIFLMDGKVQEVEKRVEVLEDTMTIDYGRQQEIGNLVNKVVINILGGKESNAYKTLGKKVFSECNRDIKNYFNVNARGNIARKDFERALNYVKNWKPCTNTLLNIQDCNAQMSF